jgi:hypothetical protein
LQLGGFAFPASGGDPGKPSQAVRCSDQQQNVMCAAWCAKSILAHLRTRIDKNYHKARDVASVKGKTILASRALSSGEITIRLSPNNVDNEPFNDK